MDSRILTTEEICRVHYSEKKYNCLIMQTYVDSEPFYTIDHVDEHGTRTPVETSSNDLSEIISFLEKVTASNKREYTKSRHSNAVLEAVEPVIKADKEFIRLIRLHQEKKLKNTNSYWGIELTKIEEMKFDKWKSDRNNCPALNTIAHEERVQILINFLSQIR